MLELAPERLRGTLHTIGSISMGFFGMLNVAFFYFVTNASLYLIVMGTLCFLHLIPVLRAPESPRFLFTQQKWDELHEALETIAYSNGVKLEKELRFRSEIMVLEDDAEEVISMKEALKDRVYLKNLLIMTFNWSVVSLSFYVISYYSNDLPGSMFMNCLFMN